MQSKLTGATTVLVLLALLFLSHRRAANWRRIAEENQARCERAQAQAAEWQQVAKEWEGVASRFEAVAAKQERNAAEAMRLAGISHAK
jgi:hypothetical protein